MDNNIGYYLCYNIPKDNVETMDKYTVWKLTLQNRCLPSEIDKLRDFEAELDNILGLLQDDTSKLLLYGKFPEN